MQVKEITVTYGRKVNLGNYQSATIEITLSASIDPPEVDPVDFSVESKEIDRLQTLARDAVHQEMLRLPRAVEGPSIQKLAVQSNGPQKATDLAPANGKELMAWLKEESDKIGINLVGFIENWGKTMKYPSRIVDWGPEEASAGYLNAVRKIRSVVPQKAPEAPRAPAVAPVPPFQPGSGEGGLLI